MSEQKKKQLTAEEELRRRDELDDVREVMRTARGRRFIWRLMQEGNIFRPCFTGNSNTYYLLGKRDFMLPIFQDVMKACPDMWSEAQKENFVEEE